MQAVIRGMFGISELQRRNASPGGGCVHTFYCPEDNTEDTVALAWIQGAQVCFNEDGTFHSINDAASIQYLTETLSAAQGTGPVGYIHGGGAGVINS